MTTRTHEWRSYAANHFECGVCGGIADNANGAWKFGTGVQPRECPGPKAQTEHRSWGKPAAAHAASLQSWPTAPAPISIDSNVKPPATWPTAAKAAPAEDSNRHAERQSTWPTTKPTWPTSTPKP